MIEGLVCEISFSWKETNGNANEYYDKKYEGKYKYLTKKGIKMLNNEDKYFTKEGMKIINDKNNISIFELVYENKYKYLSDNGIKMLKENESFIPLDDKEKIQIYKLQNDEIKLISDYIVDYINKSLTYDDDSETYYLNTTPVGVIHHSLPVYVNLNKDYLKKYDNSLFPKS
jgi:hypothetical protein